MEFTKTQQYRKVIKPLLERQRRARINKCLDQLKDLIIDCLNNDNEQSLRLEKADILEYTVEYLRKTKNEQSNKNSFESFRNGYIYAANEVSKAMASTHGIDISLGTKLMSHLGHKLNCFEKTEIQLIKSNEIVQQNSYSTLNIETQLINGNVTKLSAISPSSSGYYSDSNSSSPISSEKYFENITINNIWRPW